MRLHEPGGDSYIRLRPLLVQPHRYALAVPIEGSSPRPGIVVDDSYAGHHLVAEHPRSSARCCRGESLWRPGSRCPPAGSPRRARQGRRGSSGAGVAGGSRRRRRSPPSARGVPALAAAAGHRVAQGGPKRRPRSAAARWCTGSTTVVRSGSTSMSGPSCRTPVAPALPTSAPLSFHSPSGAFRFSGPARAGTAGGEHRGEL